jgi:hypothetical protein
MLLVLRIESGMAKKITEKNHDLNLKIHMLLVLRIESGMAKKITEKNHDLSSYAACI